MQVNRVPIILQLLFDEILLNFQAHFKWSIYLFAYCDVFALLHVKPKKVELIKWIYLKNEQLRIN